MYLDPHGILGPFAPTEKQKHPNTNFNGSYIKEVIEVAANYNCFSSSLGGGGGGAGGAGSAGPVTFITPPAGFSTNGSMGGGGSYP